MTQLHEMTTQEMQVLENMVKDALEEINSLTQENLDNALDSRYLEDLNDLIDIEEFEERKKDNRMKLLYKEQGRRHDIYLSDYDYTMSIPNDDEGKESSFGSKKYFSMWAFAEITKDNDKLKNFTPLAIEIILDNSIYWKKQELLKIIKAL